MRWRRIGYLHWANFQRRVNDVDNAGGVILFVFAVLALAVIGTYVVAFASHCFLTVCQSTSAGNKQVVWGEEPLMDWMFQGFYLVWLLVVWLIPTTMFLRVINRDIYVDDPALVLMTYGVVTWLLFPIGSLSSMSAESPWTFFRPQVLKLLGRSLNSVLLFYLLSLVFVGLGLGSWGLAFGSGSLLLIPFAGVVTTMSVLLYARLVGRLAWRVTPVRRQKKKRKPKPQDPKSPKPPPEEEVKLKGEGLMEGPPDPYQVGADREVNPALEVEPDPVETERMEGRRPVPKKERKLLQGWLSFFGDEGTLERAMAMALGLTLVGFLVRFMLAMKP